MKALLLLAALTVATASASANQMIDPTQMTCAQTQTQIRKSGRVLLYSGGFSRAWAVSRQENCPIGYDLVKTSVTTLNNRACAINICVVGSSSEGGW